MNFKIQLLANPSRYVLIQSQQWKHQNGVVSVQT